MSKQELRNSLLRELAKYLAAAIAGALALLGMNAWREAGAPAFDRLLEGLTKGLLFQLVLLLLMLCIASWIWVWIVSHKKEKPLTQQFSFNQHGGYYIDSSNGAAICPKCLAAGKVVHMMDVGGPKLCNACGSACRGPQPKTTNE